MKRIFGILLCWVMLFALIPKSGAQTALFTSGDFQYAVTAENTAVITLYTGTEPEPKIPAILDGYPVTQIGESAFRDCGFLVKADIPEGVSALGAQAFYNCAALIELNLPLSLREIGDLAFAYCTSLHTAIILDGLERIGEFAFGDCPALSTIAIPASVTWIGPDAFLGIDAGILSGIYGRVGSYAEEYARANAILFFPLTESAAEENTGAQADSEAADLPPAADDLPIEATPGPVVTMDITVQFPHADRRGSYTGETKDGLPHGKGAFTFIHADGSGYTYEGAWENGRMNGTGTLTWTDGLSCEGYFRDNQPYEGKWLISGTVIYTGGLKMCPECGAIVFHGQGELTNRLGRTIYSGRFEDGLLMETAPARLARAQALDPTCETLTDEGYLALFNIQSAGAGRLFRLEGRIGEITTDSEHGGMDFLLLNNGNAAAPISISYRYGAGEERALTGRRATVWGTVIGLYRGTDSQGRERMMLQLDADVIRMGEEPAQRGLNEVVITAVKSLEGRALKNREFTFTLGEIFSIIEERVNPLDGTVTFVPVTYTTMLQTKANGRDGTIAFDPIRYTAADIGGVFTYTVTEMAGLEAGMVYDPMEMTVTVIVSDNGTGKPAATVFYPDDVTFDNLVQAAELPLDLEVSVELAGGQLQEGAFTFQLLEGEDVLSTVTNGGDGRVVFNFVMFTAADTGTTRRFIVRQIPTDLPGITYDTMEVVFEVIAEHDPGGMGMPMLTIPPPEDTIFNNILSAEAEAGIKLNVTLEGRAIKNGEFSFELSRGGIVLQTKRNGRDGTVAFDPIPYTEADAGSTNEYTVRQVPGNEPGMNYDTSIKPVSVQVSLEDAMLKALVTYTDASRFTNRFTQQVSMPILSSVDVNKTSIKPDESVTFVPRVSGGVQPYRYHYILFRDGKEIKDIGWLQDASRTSQLSVPGLVQMKVEVQDAKGNFTQAVMSPEVTVTKPAWTPMDLSGRWTLSLTITGSTGERANSPPGTVFPMQLDVQMKDSNSGAVKYYFEHFQGTEGTITYKDGAVTIVIADEWNHDTYQGKIEFKDGIATMSGTYFEDSPRRELTYSGTWTGVKEEQQTHPPR